MARNLRQSKILELILQYEICTQDELVNKLNELGFNVTQATISRDIKELGLIKVVSNLTNKNKYVFPTKAKQISNKYIYLLKESVISIKTVKNFVVIKTLSGMSQSLCKIVDSLELDNSLGATYGDETILIIFENNDFACKAQIFLENLLNF